MEQNIQRNRATENRPSLAIIIVAVWALFQIGRLGALPIIQSVLAGNDSTAWLYPALVDTVIGVTAPFVALALWRKIGLGVWVTGLTWFCISVYDHMDAIAAALFSPIPQAFLGGVKSTVLTSLVVGTMLDIAVLVLLTRPTLRSHYLSTLRPGEAVASRPRATIIILVLWALLQIPRYIAIPIILNVPAGLDPEAWLGPALGDILIATSAPFVAYAVWRKTGLWIWVTALIWLILSIVDHLSTITAAFTTPGPQIFGGGGISAANAAFPFVQAVIDAVVFVLLARGKVKSYFLGLWQPAGA